MALVYPAPLPFSPAYFALSWRGGRFAPLGWPIYSGTVADLLWNMHLIAPSYILGSKNLLISNKSFNGTPKSTPGVTHLV